MASSHVLAQKTYAVGLGGGTAIPVGKLDVAQKAGYNGIVMLAMGVADLPFGVVQLGPIEECVREKALRRLRIAQDGGQRLVQLVQQSRQIRALRPWRVAQVTNTSQIRRVIPPGP